MLLNNKIVYITGGSSGIGRACAKLCLENGAKVIITGRNIEKLEEAKKNLSKISANLETHQFDIANTDEFRSSLNTVYESYGKIDGLVNNAPSIHSGMIKDIDFDKEIMLAGNIQINDDLENYKKIADIIDISGGLETAGLKDISKIEIFLKKLKNLNNET